MIAAPTVPTSRRVAGAVALVGFIGCILGANWAIARYGAVPVGFGLMAPAGVYVAGLAFTFRDLVQNTLGRRVSLAAIPVGAAVSALISPAFALASGVAFASSELTDFAVYTPLLRRGWLRALVVANGAGLAVDSALFLWLAFGSLQYFAGQCLGKAWMTVLALIVLTPLRRWYVVRPPASVAAPAPVAA